MSITSDVGREKGHDDRINQTPESDEDLLFLMSNLYPRHTGLPFIVWVSPRGNAQHAARVKIALRPKMVPSEMISVTINDPIEAIGEEGRISGRDFKLLRQWIELNREVLLQFWNGDIEETAAVLDALRPL